MKSLVIVLATIISFNVFAQEEMVLDKNSKLYKAANAQRLLADETAQLLETIAANKGLQQKRKKLEADSLDSIIEKNSPVATAEMTLNMIQSRLRDSDDSQYVLELSQQACMNLGTLKANGSVIKGDALIDHAARFCT